ncbi:hypothetical protein PUN28_005279 [Cardiocondyla obscurior]|uniref:Uncharacterized protein n=1 Tax=Cardiocondyla obscurior TaxID=286306 RepID=A0AAW2GI56_9HYME
MFIPILPARQGSTLFVNALINAPCRRRCDAMAIKTSLLPVPGFHGKTRDARARCLKLINKLTLILAAAGSSILSTIQPANYRVTSFRDSYQCRVFARQRVTMINARGLRSASFLSPRKPSRFAPRCPIDTPMRLKVTKRTYGNIYCMGNMLHFRLSI